MFSLIGLATFLHDFTTLFERVELVLKLCFVGCKPAGCVFEMPDLMPQGASFGLQLLQGLLQVFPLRCRHAFFEFRDVESALKLSEQKIMAEPVQLIKKCFFDGANGLTRITTYGPQDTRERVGETRLATDEKRFDGRLQGFRLKLRKLRD